MKHRKNTIIVNIPGSKYPVHLKEDFFPVLSQKLNKSKGQVYFLVDSNVYRLHAQRLQMFSDFNTNAKNRLILRVNEKNKNLDSVERIIEFLQKRGADRSSRLIIIGGGILGDIGAFAASIYMRGIPYISIPTTILAAVDSSVGGKTGVNFNRSKNFVGSFYQPESVWIDTNFFSTLPADEVKCGLGEIMKYGFLANARFFKKVKDFLESERDISSPAFKELITACIKIKADIVAQDEKETGLRKLLNLGHTFAHAIESVVDFKVKHGQAVAAGLLFMIVLSRELHMISGKTYRKYYDYCSLLELPREVKNPDINALLRAMKGDKKNQNGEFRFVLVKDGSFPLFDIAVNYEILILSMHKTANLLKSG